MWGGKTGESFVSTACHHALIVSWASVIIIPPEHTVQTLNKHLITCMYHPHPISYAFICLYKVKFVLLTYYTDQKPQMPTQLLILCAHIQKQDEEWKKNPQAKWEQNGILEWEVGNFPPIPNGFSVPGHTEGLSYPGFHLDPAALCVLYVGSWVWTQHC